MSLLGNSDTLFWGERRRAIKAEDRAESAKEGTQVALATIAIMKQKMEQMEQDHQADINATLAIKDALLELVQKLDPNTPLCQKEVREKIYLDNYLSYNIPEVNTD